MQRDGLHTRPWFSRHVIWTLTIGFVLAIILSNRVVSFVCSITPFDCPVFWPISEFSLRVAEIGQVILSLTLLIGFFPLVRMLSRKKYPLFMIVVVGTVLVMATNMTQGWRNGFEVPMTGLRNAQYYGDAVEITDPATFFTQFEQIQPSLRVHSKTHPPGAVLLFYALNRLLGSPEWISVAIAVLTVPASMLFLYALLSTVFTDQTISRYMIFLFVLLPSVQIYYAASLDAVIAALLLGGLACFVRFKTHWGIILTAILVFLASFITFGWIFIIPVLVGYEFLSRRTIWRTLVILGMIGLAYVSLSALTGFAYWDSFTIASLLENPHGFRLLAEPVNYTFTRLEDIAEFIVFLGPFLTLLFWRGLRGMRVRQPQLFGLSVLGIGTVLLMLATGAFRTGETARVCLFLYPYVLFPVASYLEAAHLRERETVPLLTLVFAQSVLMQLFGIYVW